MWGYPPARELPLIECGEPAKLPVTPPANNVINAWSHEIYSLGEQRLESLPHQYVTLLL
jgi:hypothetical protein